MNETVEAVIDCLSDHFSSRHQFGIKAVKDIFQVFSFPRLFWIKQLQKLLNKWWGDMHLKRLHLGSFINNQLEEELIDRLKMRPSRIHKIFLLFHSHTLSRQTCFLKHRQWPEDIFLDHVNNQIQVRYDDCGHAVLISQVIVKFLQISLSIAFLPNMFAVIIEIEWCGAVLQFP